MQPQEISSTKIAEAKELYGNGASAHYVATKCKLTFDQALKLQKEYAEELRKQALEYRFLLRNTFRQQLTKALATLVGVHSDSLPGFKWEELEKKPGVLKEKLAYLRARLDAAKAIVAAGQKFIDDDLVNLHTERPENTGDVQGGYDYESTVCDDGATLLTIRPRPLKLVQGSTEPPQQTLFDEVITE